ncbi:hypothetical protein MW7_006470 [Imbroritus primus]|uniref:Uncharacterized protein n=1 Tax=Imbroritus primus TaxID=3058603 RepID=A0ACD3SQ92_9BURK|nr:hypothetical protein MW7_006470 [Burkholderiaceae bacterium PBA]
MTLYALLLFIHLAGVVLWVGGMFFAYVCLRPTAAEALEPPLRLRLWQGVFRRFFVWVWIAVIGILLSGFAMLGHMGFAAAPKHLHAMAGGGVVMAAIFVYVFAAPYQALSRAVAAQDWAAGGAALARIRRAVHANLWLGILVIVIATVGRALT